MTQKRTISFHLNDKQLSPDMMKGVGDYVECTRLTEVGHAPDSGVILTHPLHRPWANPDLIRCAETTVEYVKSKYNFIPEHVNIKPADGSDKLLVKLGGGYFNGNIIRYGDSTRPAEIGNITISANIHMTVEQSNEKDGLDRYKEMLHVLGIPETGLSIFVAVLLHELGHAHTVLLFAKEDLSQQLDLMHQYVHIGQQFVFAGMEADDIDRTMWNHLNFDEARADLFVWKNMLYVWNAIPGTTRRDSI